jgi:hypothetical protein
MFIEINNSIVDAMILYKSQDRTSKKEIEMIQKDEIASKCCFAVTEKSAQKSLLRIFCG